MGRRPNALILQYFERGPKLQDQSNRYPHTCKSCGEHFPRGRLDSLTNHLTKKCPAISEADRVNALLTLSGMGHDSQRIQHNNQAQARARVQAQVQAQVQAHTNAQANGTSLVDLPMMQRDMQRDDEENWTALGVLAEVSRQIDMSEKNDDRIQPHLPLSSELGSLPPATHTAERFESQEQLSLENHAQGQGSRPAKEKQVAEEMGTLPDANNELTPEERLQEILRADDARTDSETLSMAATAAAAAAVTARLHPVLPRLHPELLDPQLLGAEAAAAAEAASATVTATDAPATTAAPESSMAAVEQIHTHDSSPNHAESPSQPWGEIYIDSGFPAMASDATAQNIGPLAKGGFRLETTGLNGAKSRHSRARFNATRRKQVQEVRKIGACIRCRVLRKTCSQGQPCDTCRKVLSPRVWRSGCVRTKFSEQLDLYSAGVQIVQAQHRINTLKQSVDLGSHGIFVEVYHFPELATRLRLQVLQRDGTREGDGNADPGTTDATVSNHRIMMLDNDAQDVPSRVEMYMREVLPELIKRETSHFMQVTLQTAVDIASSTNDELLRKSLELWGLVEILDRERQWTIGVKPGVGDVPVDFIKEDSDEEVFTTICLQLTAAAERKAAATSKALLTGMQRVLQDSKVKVNFNMYFATLILLNCVEKSTWAFKAWEQPNLRPQWPLQKEPNSFTQQGYVIADLLRMLLGIRKALPRTLRRETDGKLVTEEVDPTMQGYFESIGLDFAQVKANQEHPVFSPTDPRSFELLFCSTLLLPTAD
ncbi:hypothetical protein B0T26DRAFT_643298 [Lasiosphaeria miniovina]|uniref:Zn(2)-C6 fungal-type domain-containing protein n=1 Tax=Lasiosphaeria miniovina TaxID=1954250 RepID=A0AA40AUN9_9PEZI|nr:uncharacterized protein B0T26DRAFT_643298 [Lasiosphaeria miniovina]KAK0722292.1 hypothetical protein B0T26DRAFT_643298 [Lasiosphaeria miniovina]